MSDKIKKEMFRATMLEKRNSVKESYYIIKEGFQLLPDYGTVAFYSPIKNEPDLTLLWEKAWEKNLCVLFPKIISNIKMVFCPILSYKDLKQGKWDIWEPNTKPYNGEIDIVFVPGICFGEDGSRMGYGAGYYDRFFFNNKSYLVGVCQEEMICNNIPIDPHDVFMDAVLTNRRLILH